MDMRHKAKCGTTDAAVRLYMEEWSMVEQYESPNMMIGANNRTRWKHKWGGHQLSMCVCGQDCSGVDCGGRTERKKKNMTECSGHKRMSVKFSVAHRWRK